MRSLLPPSGSRSASQANRRLTNLERRLRPPSQNYAQLGAQIVTFHFPGALDDLDVSDPWSHPTGSVLQYIVVNLTQAGSTDTEVQLLRNSVEVFLGVIEANAIHTQLGVEVFFGSPDQLTVATPTVGTGAEGIVISGVFAS